MHHAVSFLLLRYNMLSMKHVPRVGDFRSVSVCVMNARKYSALLHTHTEEMRMMRVELMQLCRCTPKRSHSHILRTTWRVFGTFGSHKSSQPRSFTSVRSRNRHWKHIRFGCCDRELELVTRKLCSAPTLGDFLQASATTTASHPPTLHTHFGFSSYFIRLAFPRFPQVPRTDSASNHKVPQFKSSRMYFVFVCVCF